MKSLSKFVRLWQWHVVFIVTITVTHEVQNSKQTNKKSVSQNIIQTFHHSPYLWCMLSPSNSSLNAYNRLMKYFSEKLFHSVNILRMASLPHCWFSTKRFNNNKKVIRNPREGWKVFLVYVYCCKKSTNNGIVLNIS